MRHDDEFRKSMPEVDWDAVDAAGGNKFAPRLDHERRCQVLALYKAGAGNFTKALLAEYFRISLATVIHIVDTGNLRFYPAVKREYVGLGENAFKRKYASPNHIAKLAELSAMRVRTPPPPPSVPNTPSKNYNSMAGNHTYVSPLDEEARAFNFDVFWVEPYELLTPVEEGKPEHPNYTWPPAGQFFGWVVKAHGSTGYYIKVTTRAEPDPEWPAHKFWFHTMSCFRTSREAYDAACRVIDNGTKPENWRADGTIAA
jgi:hypothetical protein